MNENCNSCGSGNRWMGQNRGMCMNRNCCGMNRMGQRSGGMENMNGDRGGGCGFRRCGEAEARNGDSRQGCGCKEEEKKSGCGCGEERRGQNNMQRSCGCGTERRGRGCVQKSSCDMGCSSMQNQWNPCCREEKPVDEMNPGMGYVPWQKFENVLCAEDGFDQGTIFKDLILPFYGRPINGMGGNGTCNRTRNN